MALIDQIIPQIWGEKGSADQFKVTLSYAQTLDGSIALQRGTAFPMSSPESMRFTHQLRANHQAIMVGIGTVLADNPRLTVRLVEGPHPQPIILDSHLRIPLGANLLDGLRPPWIITTLIADREKAALLESKGARVLFLANTSDGKIQLPALMDILVELQIKSLMIEGGAALITNILAEQLADGLVLTITPFLSGGLRAVERLLVNAKAISDDKLTFTLPRLEQTYSSQLGRDIVIWGHLKWGGQI
ncbi:MAG: RibD family protein [Anaerolineales bacterium]